MSENTSFWVIWSPMRGVAHGRYLTEEAARGEAEAQLRLVPEAEIYVLRAVSRFALGEAPIHETRLDSSPPGKEET